MKKFGVIHSSDNFIDGIGINQFDTKPEAEKYVKDFITNKDVHKNDRAIIIENLGEFEAKVIDQTPDKRLYGFRESK
jgi:hypothetical protein